MDKYYMSNYPDLIERIFTSSKQSQIQSLRKLIYLSVNDQSKFSSYVPQLAQQLPKTLTNIEDQQVKLLSLQLLSEMATNYTSRIPAQCYSFPQLVALLSDENPQVRKAAHYLILIFIKKYEQIDQVIEGYLKRIQQAPEHWKILQKIIHSFQSLLVIEPKCVTYSQNYTHLDDFMRLLLENRNHQHSLVQKASQQTVNSFVKNQYVPEILPKLDKRVMKQLVQYAQKISISLQPKRISPRKQPQKQSYANKDDDIEQIKIIHRKISVLQQLLLKLDSQSDWKIKSQTIQQISNELVRGDCQIPEDLIEKVLDLTYDYNFKTCITAMNVLLTIVTLYPSKISSKHRQIEDVVIDKICDLKMAVRQLANKILRNLYPNQSKDFMKRILAKLNNCSIVGKEQILNFLQQVFTNNIITDLNLVLSEISNQLLNENTRIKIKAIDCLVKICLVNDVEECKIILSKKLNKVYYDMFLERLNSKIGFDKADMWDQKAKLKKGMTWQAPERVIQIPTQKQAMTKIQFGNKKVFNETEEDFAFSNPSNSVYKTKQRQLAATSSNSYKTANTFNTFKSVQETTISTRIQKKSTEASQPSSFIGFIEDEAKKQSEKKIPMKPTPIKKKTISQTPKDQAPLVIHSKQYQIKNNDDKEADSNSNDYQPSFKSLDKKFEERKQNIEDKPRMKINRNRDKSNIKQKEEETKQMQKTRQIPTQPFTIKKSVSKKQHVIDYKATHYAAKDDLSPLDDPKETLKFIMTNLPKDNDWNKQFESLDFLRRIIKNHQDFYPVLNQNMPGVMPQVLKLVQSLRSSVAKNAMITLSQMCQALKKAMDPYLQPLFVKLFKKAQDANTFIVEQVRKCMSSLCTYCTTAKICSIIISNSNAKAIPIKINVALCIEKILQKKDYDLQILKQNTKIVSVMSNMIIDSSSQVRNISKQIFIQLLSSNSSSQVQGLFKRNSSKDSWQKWKSIMDKQTNIRK